MKYQCSKYEQIKSKNNQNFEILRKIDKEENLTQRKLAGQLGFSLGKLKFFINMNSEKRFVKN